LAIFAEAMRQIHLGKRLADDILYSQKTYELDTETTVSALSDIINAHLNRVGIASTDQTANELGKHMAIRLGI